jgi:hypothetical protein
VIFALGALATALLLIRIMVAPQFAYVTSSDVGGGVLGLSPTLDTSATQALKYDRSGPRIRPARSSRRDVQCS